MVWAFPENIVATSNKRAFPDAKAREVLHERFLRRYL